MAVSEQPAMDDALDLILHCLQPLATAANPGGRCSLPMDDQLAGARRNVEQMARRIAALEAENEWLKVCGNCGDHDDAVYSYCAIDGHAVPYSIRCKFTPSRWTSRATP